MEKLTSGQRKVLAKLKEGVSIERLDVNGKRGKYRQGDAFVRPATVVALSSYTNSEKRVEAGGYVAVRIYTWNGKEEV